RAAMALGSGDAETAVDLAERFLRAVPKETRLVRVGGLELLVQALAVRGDYVRAEAVLAEFRTATATIATRPMHASTRSAEGAIAAAAADYDRAKSCFQDAIDLWTRSGAPFEAALARVGLAQSLLALGRKQAAEQEAREAAAALRQLGALPAATHAAALAREIAALPRAQSDTVPAVLDLTPRELEVLRLIAAGKSNQEIARELVLSVRTVERHISNIYSKAGASGTAARAAATAYAL